nr:guanylate-binding protein 1-like [Microcebus murinus]
MASAIHMPGPVCLIENTKGQLAANQEALKTLSAITQPVVVVAIVGLSRTGKSYLMNKLAGKKNGFSLGCTVQSHTKGIWMWCVPHPSKSDHTLVLLDTEGLGDVEKGDNQNDSWIFSLAILLSSTFVYNSMGIINQQAMDQLHYVTELTDQIRAKSSLDAIEGEDSVEFVSFFPDFVWTLRDVTLKLEVDGQSLTPDEYLENSLKLKQGNSEKDKIYNLPRLCIRKFFPKKKCFVFYPPTDWKKLDQLETLRDGELDCDFVQQVEKFCCYTFSHSKTKTLPGGIKVDGPRLQSLVLTYVSAINSGDVPCMENAVLALAQTENSAAVQKAIAHYEQQMKKVELPTETLQELLDLHSASEKEATEIFSKSSFRDVNHIFQMELVCQLEKRQKDFCKQNQEASSDRCQALIQRIFSPLEEELTQGSYLKPGVKLMKAESEQTAAKMEDMKTKYEQMLEEKEKNHQENVTRLAEQLEKDRANIMAEQERILTHKLQEQERHFDDEITEERRKYQKEIQDMEMRNREMNLSLKEAITYSSQREAEMAVEMERKCEQMMEQKEKSYQEHMTQLTEKMEKEKAQLLKEHENIIACQLEDQEKRFNKRIKEINIEHQQEIQNIKKQADQSFCSLM